MGSPQCDTVSPQPPESLNRSSSGRPKPKTSAVVRWQHVIDCIELEIHSAMLPIIYHHRLLPRAQRLYSLNASHQHHAIILYNSPRTHLIGLQGLGARSFKTYQARGTKGAESRSKRGRAKETRAKAGLEERDAGEEASTMNDGDQNIIARYYSGSCCPSHRTSYTPSISALAQYRTGTFTASYPRPRPRLPPNCIIL